MGNQNAKKSIESPFTNEELKVLEANYRSVCGHSERVKKEKLLESWSTVDSSLAIWTANYLFTDVKQKIVSISFEQFAKPFYIVERGTLDEKISFIVTCLNQSIPNEILVKDLENYVTSVFRSYLEIQSKMHTKAFVCWSELGYNSAERTILSFSKGILRTITKEDEHGVKYDQLERWLQENPTFLIIWREVFEHLYGGYGGKIHHLSNNPPSHILPMVDGLVNDKSYTPILEIPHIIYINSHLPNEFRHKWRFLFSSKIMGESFSTMLGRIIHKGPTLIIIEDEERYIFGGFAVESWALRPHFVGDDRSLLYTLCPAMRCFTATGYNNHYQYLNLNQQTMPNGLGMGGQHDFWGLWIDSEYGKGQSCESCTTFRDYVQLSKRKEFRIRNVEVWGVGDEPKINEDDDDEEGFPTNHSVLDKNMEDRVMLELAGKSMHSDGFRDPDLDL